MNVSSSPCGDPLYFCGLTSLIGDGGTGTLVGFSGASADFLTVVALLRVV